MKIKNIIFDFGGVLVDWNPRYFYKTVFSNQDEMEHFLKTICTEEWNMEQDRGRSLAEGTKILQEKYPVQKDLIQLFYDNWNTMLHSDIPETVELLHKVKNHFKLYGLTNWSAETFPTAYKRFPFFGVFEGIVVSGTEKMVKPDLKIFQLILDRYKLNPAETLFIDDNFLNIQAGKKIGLHTIHYKNSSQLKTDLSVYTNSNTVNLSN